MTYENLARCLPFEASGDLSTKQYLFVKIDANGQLAVCGDGVQADGVLQDKPSAAGHAGNVAVLNAGNISKVKAGGTITAGALVSSDSAGKAVTYGTGDEINGKALKSGVSGDIIPVLLATYENPLR